jgi:hypothetical protein
MEYFEHTIDAGQGCLFSIPNNNVTAIPEYAGTVKTS